MAPTTRQFKLRIWGLALGYFFFYTPYTAVIKIVTTGLWPGVNGSVSGFQLLPPTVMATAVVLTAIVSVLGWWKHATVRRVLGVAIPVPSRLVVLSGIGTAIIIGTTTLAYASTGVSILLALLLLRGGVLIIAPVVDVVFKRSVRWFSWLALAFAFTGVLVALADVNSYHMTLLAALNIAAYLTGYLLRLPCINTLAKCDDACVTYRFFVEEQMVAVIVLVGVTAMCAAIGAGPIMMDLRSGFTGFFTSSTTLPGLVAGSLYACLYCFGTLIYLDRRENTFCLPLNRCSTVLSGIVATYALALLFNQPTPSPAQLSSAGVIVVALLLLSPLHHVRRYASAVQRSAIGAYRVCLTAVAGFGRPRPVPAPFVQPARPAEGGIGQIVFLFVCAGNTCRSPMAAAIGNAEIAARLQIPADGVGDTSVQALSAGVSARVGAPMTPEAQHALRSLGIQPPPHSARNVTADLVGGVEKIFCMTRAHRRAVIDLVPAAAAKTQCLDPDGDVDDPIGSSLAAYISCAQRIQSLVRLQFDQISLQGGLS